MTDQSQAEQTPTDADIEVLEPGYAADPYALYQRLRDQQPVHKVRLPIGNDAWLITRYDDVRAVLTDPRLQKDPRKLAALGGRAGGPPVTAVGELNSDMLNRDPPDHTRLRRLVSKAFTMRRVEQLRPRVEEIAGDLVAAMDRDAADHDGVTDLLAAFAFPLPITVICELLGMPAEDRDDFRAWTRRLIGTFGPAEGEFVSTVTEMMGYNRRLLAAKRAHPGDDLLSALIEAKDSGDWLNDNELLSMMFLLLVAGHETTVNLIGNGMLALLTHPDQFARLRREPSLLPSAVEELLRFANPVNHASFRFAVEPVEIAGTKIPAGDLVLAMVSSANRDGARFPRADDFDLDRDASGHMSFGHGIHHCLGAPLARLEGEIAFCSLLRAFPGIELAVPADQLRYNPGTLIRGLTALPVRLNGAVR